MQIITLEALLRSTLANQIGPQLWVTLRRTLNHIADLNDSKASKIPDAFFSKLHPFISEIPPLICRVNTIISMHYFDPIETIGQIDAFLKGNVPGYAEPYKMAQIYVGFLTSSSLKLDITITRPTIIKVLKKFQLYLEDQSRPEFLNVLCYGIRKMLYTTAFQVRPKPENKQILDEYKKLYECVEPLKKKTTIGENAMAACIILLTVCPDDFAMESSWQLISYIFKKPFKIMKSKAVDFVVQLTSILLRSTAQALRTNTTAGNSEKDRKTINKTLFQRLDVIFTTFFNAKTKLFDNSMALYVQWILIVASYAIEPSFRFIRRLLDMEIENREFGLIATTALSSIQEQVTFEHVFDLPSQGLFFYYPTPLLSLPSQTSAPLTEDLISLRTDKILQVWHNTQKHGIDDMEKEVGRKTTSLSYTVLFSGSIKHNNNWTTGISQNLHSQFQDHSSLYRITSLLKPNHTTAIHSQPKLVKGQLFGKGLANILTYTNANTQTPFDNAPPTNTSFGSIAALKNKPASVNTDILLKVMIDLGKKLILSQNPSQTLHDYLQHQQPQNTANPNVIINPLLITNLIRLTFLNTNTKLKRTDLVQLIISMSCFPDSSLKDEVTNILTYLCLYGNDFTIVCDSYISILSDVQMDGSGREVELLTCLNEVIRRWTQGLSRTATTIIATQPEPAIIPSFTNHTIHEPQDGNRQLVSQNTNTVVYNMYPNEFNTLEAILIIFLCSPSAQTRENAVQLIYGIGTLQGLLARLSGEEYTPRTCHILEMESSKIIASAAPLIDSWSVHPRVGTKVTIQSILMGNYECVATDPLVSSLTDYSSMTRNIPLLNSVEAVTNAVKSSVMTDEDARVVVTALATIPIHNVVPDVCDNMLRLLQRFIPRLIKRLFETGSNGTVTKVYPVETEQEKNAVKNWAALTAVYLTVHSKAVGIGIIPPNTRTHSTNSPPSITSSEAVIFNAIFAAISADNDFHRREGMLTLCCPHPSLYRALLQFVVHPLFVQQPSPVLNTPKLSILGKLRLHAAATSAFISVLSSFFLPWRQDPKRLPNMFSNMLQKSTLLSKSPTRTPSTQSFNSRISPRLQDELESQLSKIVLQPVVIWDMIRTFNVSQFWACQDDSSLAENETSNEYAPAAAAYNLVTRRNQVALLRWLLIHKYRSERTMNEMGLRKDEYFTLFPHNDRVRIHPTPSENPMPVQKAELERSAMEIFFPPVSVLPFPSSNGISLSYSAVPAVDNVASDPNASTRTDSQSPNILTAIARDVPLGLAKYIQSYIWCSESSDGVPTQLEEAQFEESESEPEVVFNPTKGMTSEITTADEPITTVTQSPPSSHSDLNTNSRASLAHSHKGRHESLTGRQQMNDVVTKLFSTQVFSSDTSSRSSLTANVRLRSTLVPPLSFAEHDFLSSSHKFILFTRLYASLSDLFVYIDIFSAMRIHDDRSVSAPTATAFSSPNDALSATYISQLSFLHCHTLEVMSMLLDGPVCHPALFYSPPIPSQTRVLDTVTKAAIHSGDKKDSAQSGSSAIVDLDYVENRVSFKPFNDTTPVKFDLLNNTVFSPSSILTNTHPGFSQKRPNNQTNSVTIVNPTPERHSSDLRNILSEQPMDNFRTTSMFTYTSTNIPNAESHSTSLQTTFQRSVRYQDAKQIDKTYEMYRQIPTATVFELYELNQVTITPPPPVVVWNSLFSSGLSQIKQDWSVFVPSERTAQKSSTQSERRPFPFLPPIATPRQVTGLSKSIPDTTSVRAIHLSQSHGTYVVPLGTSAPLFPSIDRTSNDSMVLDSITGQALTAATSALNDLGVYSTDTYKDRMLSPFQFSPPPIQPTGTMQVPSPDKTTMISVPNYSINDIRSVGTGLHMTHFLRGKKTKTFSTTSFNPNSLSSGLSHGSSESRAPVNLTALPVVNTADSQLTLVPPTSLTNPAPVWYCSTLPNISPTLPSSLATDPADLDIPTPHATFTSLLPIILGLSADPHFFGLSPFSQITPQRLRALFAPFLLEPIQSNTNSGGNRLLSVISEGSGSIEPTLDERLLRVLLSMPSTPVGGDGIILDWINKTLQAPHPSVRHHGMKGLIRCIRHNTQFLPTSIGQCYRYFSDEHLSHAHLTVVADYFPAKSVTPVSALLLALSSLTSFDPRARARASKLLYRSIRAIQIEFEHDKNTVSSEQRDQVGLLNTKPKTRHGTKHERVKMAEKIKTNKLSRFRSSSTFHVPLSHESEELTSRKSPKEQQNSEDDEFSSNSKPDSDFFITDSEMDPIEILDGSASESSDRDTKNRNSINHRYFRETARQGYHSVVQSIRTILFRFSGDIHITSIPVGSRVHTKQYMSSATLESMDEDEGEDGHTVNSLDEMDEFVCLTDSSDETDEHGDNLVALSRSQSDDDHIRKEYTQAQSFFSRFNPSINSQDSTTLSLIQQAISSLMAENFPHLFPQVFAESIKQFMTANRAGRKAILNVLHEWIHCIFEVPSLRIPHLRTFFEFTLEYAAIFADDFSRLWAKAVRDIVDFKLVVYFLLNFGSDYHNAVDMGTIPFRLGGRSFSDYVTSNSKSNTLLEKLSSIGGSPQLASSVNTKPQDHPTRKGETEEDLAEAHRFHSWTLNHQHLFHISSPSEIPLSVSSTTLFTNSVAKSSFDAVVGHIFTAIAPLHLEFLANLTTLYLIPRPLNNLHLHRFVHHTDLNLSSQVSVPCNCHLRRDGLPSTLSMLTNFCTSPQIETICGIPNELQGDLPVFTVTRKSQPTNHLNSSPVPTVSPQSMLNDEAPSPSPAQFPVFSRKRTHKRTVSSIDSRTHLSIHTRRLDNPRLFPFRNTSPIPPTPSDVPHTFGESVFIPLEENSKTLVQEPPQIVPSVVVTQRNSPNPAPSEDEKEYGDLDVVWKEQPLVTTAVGQSWQITLELLATPRLTTDLKQLWDSNITQTDCSHRHLLEVVRTNSYDVVGKTAPADSSPITFTDSFTSLTQPRLSKASFRGLFSQFRNRIHFYTSNSSSSADRGSMTFTRATTPVPERHLHEQATNHFEISLPLTPLSRQDSTPLSLASVLEDMGDLLSKETPSDPFLSPFSLERQSVPFLRSPSGKGPPTDFPLSALSHSSTETHLNPPTQTSKQNNEQFFIELKEMDLYFTLPLLEIALEYSISVGSSRGHPLKYAKRTHRRITSFLAHKGNNPQSEQSDASQSDQRSLLKPTKHTRSKTMAVVSLVPHEPRVSLSRSPAPFRPRGSTRSRSPYGFDRGQMSPQLGSRKSSTHKRHSRTGQSIHLSSSRHRRREAYQKHRHSLLEEQNRQFDMLQGRLQLLDTNVGPTVYHYTTLVVKDICRFGRMLTYRMPPLWSKIFTNPISSTECRTFGDVAFPASTIRRINDQSSLPPCSQNSLQQLRDSMEMHVSNPYSSTFNEAYMSLMLLSLMTPRNPSVISNKFVALVHYCVVMLDVKDSRITFVRSMVIQVIIQMIRLNYPNSALTPSKQPMYDVLIAKLLDDTVPLWPLEFPLPDCPAPSEADVASFVLSVVKVISVTEADEILTRHIWASYALSHSLTERYVQRAARSHHIFRALCVTASLDDCQSLFIEILRCLSFPTFENLALVTECLVSLETLIHLMDPTLLSTAKDLFWHLAALLQSNFVSIFFWTCRCLQAFFKRTLSSFSDPTMVQFFSEEISEPGTWGVQFEGLLPLLLKGLFNSATEHISYSLIVQLLPIIELPLFATATSPRRLIVAVFLPLLASCLRNLTREKLSQTVLNSIPSCEQPINFANKEQPAPLQGTSRDLFFEDEVPVNPNHSIQTFSLPSELLDDQDEDDAKPASPRMYHVETMSKRNLDHNADLPLLDTAVIDSARCSVVSFSNYKSPLNLLEVQFASNFVVQQQRLRELLTDSWLTSSTVDAAPPPQNHIDQGFHPRLVEVVRLMNPHSDEEFTPSFISGPKQADRIDPDSVPPTSFQSGHSFRDHPPNPVAYPHITSVTSQPMVGGMPQAPASCYESYRPLITPPPLPCSAAFEEASYFAAKLAVSCLKSDLAGISRILFKYSLGLYEHETQFLEEAVSVLAGTLVPPFDKVIFEIWLDLLKRPDSAHHASILQVLKFVFVFIEVPSQHSAIRRPIALELISEACKHMNTINSVYAFQLLDVVFHRTLRLDPNGLLTERKAAKNVEKKRDTGKDPFKLKLPSSGLDNIDIAAVIEKAAKDDLFNDTAHVMEMNPAKLTSSSSPPEQVNEKSHMDKIVEQTRCFCQSLVPPPIEVAPLGLLPSIAMSGLFEEEQVALSAALPPPEHFSQYGNEYTATHPININDSEDPSHLMFSLADKCMLLTSPLPEAIRKRMQDESKRFERKVNKRGFDKHDTGSKELQRRTRDARIAANSLAMLTGNLPQNPITPYTLTYLRSLWTWHPSAPSFSNDDNASVYSFHSFSPDFSVQQATFFSLPIVTESGPYYLHDCYNLIIAFGQKSDFSYHSFLSVWGEMKFSLIHEVRPEDVEDDDFLQELYRIFLDFLGIQDQPPYVRVGAIFGLYTLYYTHSGEKIPIKVDDTAMRELLRVQQEVTTLNASDAFFALRHLRVVDKAFTYTAVMETIGPPFTLPEEDAIIAVPADWHTRNGIQRTVDIYQMQQMQMRYERAKADAISDSQRAGVRTDSLKMEDEQNNVFQQAYAEMLKHQTTVQNKLLEGFSDLNQLEERRQEMRRNAKAQIKRDIPSRMDDSDPNMEPMDDNDDDDIIRRRGGSDGMEEDGGRRSNHVPQKRGRKSMYIVDQEQPAPVNPNDVQYQMQLYQQLAAMTPEQWAYLEQQDPNSYQQYRAYYQQYAQHAEQQMQ
ncbi:putative snRNA-activating protein complex subunit 1 [Blattamonas nauphoetae]|uniref:snRNA-activating protein complex subunit 1 n=1 Tax=Blattamonas nauphoetae TaxID=2049346 RepID=A0ABQ9YL78_9EUKA|nr:putative snRNA-activating protein complex subunit 1 [Blattamonas nauphoetae]